MKKNVVVFGFLFILLILNVGCKRVSNNGSPFAKKKNLISFLNKKNIHIGGDVIVFILQRELCSCTDDDMVFTKEMSSSTKYDGFRKIIIIPDSSHSIIARIKKSHASNVQFVIDHDNADLEKNGLFLTVNRVFIFKDTDIVKLSDMHLTHLKELRSQYL